MHRLTKHHGRWLPALFLGLAISAVTSPCF